MSRDGWKVARIASFSGLNRRTVSKYLGMSEEEFLEYQELIFGFILDEDPLKFFDQFILVQRY